MAKFVCRFTQHWTETLEVEVEADDEDDAVEIARQQALEGDARSIGGMDPGACDLESCVMKGKEK